MEKGQLVDFIAKVMEESGFKVYKDFKASKHVVDIYAVYPTIIGDFISIVSCKNYDEKWEVGLDVLKEMEMIGKSLKASKVVIVSTSSFSQPAKDYSSRRNIGLIDRDELVKLAKKFANDKPKQKINYVEEEYNIQTDTRKYNDDINEKSLSYDYDTPEYSSSFYETPKRSRNLSSKRPSLFKRSMQNNKKEKRNIPWLKIIDKIINNPLFQIILVIVLVSLISAIIQNWTNMAKGLLGIVKIVLTAIISYSLVLILEKDGTKVLLKGSTLFFISLIIIILMIILL